MPEKRSSKRHPKRLSVKFGAKRPEIQGVTENISKGGMFIRASTLFPPPTNLQIELPIPDGVARMSGEVRWVRNIPPNPLMGTEGGMGITITETTEEKVDKEEISSAAEVMHAMTKASNAIRVYPSGNPLLQRFLVELKGKMEGHLEGYGDLRLDIDHFEMRYKGKAVYENRDPKESMAFRMYSDGIRSLIFSEGVEGEEISAFLEIMGKDSTGGFDDDMVTLLWERDLPHVTYILAEDYLEFDSGDAVPAPVAPMQENIKSLYSEMPNTLTAAPMVIPQNILTLNESEMEWLRNARETEEKRNPVEEVIDILTSILFAEKDFATFGRFVDITAKMTGNLMHSGEVDYAMRLIRFLKGLSESEKLSSYHLDRLKKAMEGVVAGEIINDVARIIDTTEKVSAKGLRELLLIFGKTAIKQIWEILAVVQKRDMRRVVLDTLVEIGKDTPESFFPFLTDSRWYMIRNAVYIIRTIGCPSAVEPVSRLIYHGESKVRREAFLYLAGMPDAKAMGYIIKFLQDKESTLRINAVNALAGSGFKEALKPIREIVASKEFEKKEMPEKKVLFEAMGRLGSDEVVPMMKDMLMKRYWFNREKEKEQALLAVSGLRRAGTAMAVKTLEEAAARKKGEVKGIISQALKGISAEGAKR